MDIILWARLKFIPTATVSATFLVPQVEYTDPLFPGVLLGTWKTKNENDKDTSRNVSLAIKINDITEYGPARSWKLSA